ncbi:hypothetical protein BCV70DRAFT_160884 [Testicularia cyperi]|uniref:Ketoreductase (KR) domain-containing protein n=1 Tax=Testicularia cyperi TaxID=1882483 RepID=A0A317XQL3_9BASI|nr:hypothetical protein BCV70DRAFT_160884 [Testicularia cyperi]
MPVHFLASAVSSTVPTEYWASIAAGMFAISFLKTWSRGAKLLDPPTRNVSAAQHQAQFNDLHGRVVMVASGAFTPLGVVTISALAHRGAQIIALTEHIDAQDTLQLIHLLRDSTQNELIYAEQCDIGSLEDITRFTSQWNEGDKKQAEGIRRLDSLIFLPPSREQIQHMAPELAASVYNAHVRGKFHMINSMLSSLLLLPPDREIRIVSCLSPFYAAGLTHFDSIALPSSSQRSASFSVLTGAASLRWYALSVELQRRLNLLAEADPRPRTKLPGIDVDQATKSPMPKSDTLLQHQHGRTSNIVLLNVCPGFERNADVIDTFLPLSSSSTTVSVFYQLKQWLRVLVLLVLWPFVWLLSKSPATAAESVVWISTKKLESQSEFIARLQRRKSQPSQTQSTQSPSKGGLVDDEQDDVVRWDDPLLPTELYREARIVRPRLPDRFSTPPPSPPKNNKDQESPFSILFTEEEKLVEAAIKAKGGKIRRPKI